MDIDGCIAFSPSACRRLRLPSVTPVPRSSIPDWSIRRTCFCFRILLFASWTFASLSDLRRRCSAAALCCSPVCHGSTAWWVDAHGACAAASALRRRSSSWILRLHSCGIRRVFCVFRFGERLPSFRPSVARFSTLPSVQRLVSWPCTDWSASFGIIVRGCRRVRLLLFAHRHFLHPSISALSRSEFARFLGLCWKEELWSSSPSRLISSSLVGCFLS